MKKPTFIGIEKEIQQIKDSLKLSNLKREARAQLEKAHTRLGDLERQADQVVWSNGEFDEQTASAIKEFARETKEVVFGLLKRMDGVGNAPASQAALKSAQGTMGGLLVTDYDIDQGED